MRPLFFEEPNNKLISKSDAYFFGEIIFNCSSDYKNQVTKMFIFKISQLFDFIPIKIRCRKYSNHSNENYIPTFVEIVLSMTSGTNYADYNPKTRFNFY
jgi:hypothetical protein